ncbi:MAG: sensor histidine kinase [Planctomycetes bacterium]|nr:sensor histidine kinase [Planctomycetota bacterium]
MRGFSLASRFLVTLVVTAVLPLVLYGWFSLRGMRDQIDEKVVRVFLPQLAADHAQKIEAHLERTWQACALVRELARIDLDSREALRQFDEQVALVPGLLDTYVDLLMLAAPDGRVVYWQDGQRLDPNAHARRAALIPRSVAGEPWFVQAQQERGAHFLPWGRSQYLHRGVEFRSMDPASHHLGLTLDVPSGNGAPAVLFALIRWSEVQLVLDQARRALLDRAGLPNAQVLLASRDGTITAHTDRRHYGERLPDGLRAQVTAATAMGRGSFTAAGEPWRVGFAPCTGKAGGSFVVGVVVPEADLFAASDAFERVLLVAILVSVFVLVMWSLVASRAITAPVQALVAATRRIAGGDLAVALPPRGGSELGELAGAFNTMAGELATGREKLAAAQRDQAWAEMARQVAHEVKNPLQPMRMAAQLLQRARQEQDPRAELVAERLARTVLEQTEALDRIASDFRAFAGVAPAQRQETAVAAWLEQLREQLTGLFVGKAVALEVTVDAAVGALRVAIDQKALARVFVNLLQNAHEAAPGGVRVRLAAARAGERVAVVVQDDGPGIPEAVRGRLFEPYFTTKTSGTGLGLAICRRLAEAHGGSIRLERSGAGETVFVLELPLVQAG